MPLIILFIEPENMHLFIGQILFELLTCTRYRAGASGHGMLKPGLHGTYCLGAGSGGGGARRDG